MKIGYENQRLGSDLKKGQNQTDGVLRINEI